MKINFGSLETIFVNKQFSGKYDRPNKLVLMEYDGIPNTEIIKEGIEKIISYAHKNAVITTVTNLTAMKGAFTSVNSYFKERFTPAMQALGRKYAVMISSNDPFTKYAINTISSYAPTMGVELISVSSIQACEEWLSKQKEYEGV